MRGALAELGATLSQTERPGAILLYDEGHVLADDRARERYPLSGLRAALAAVQREHQQVRIILCGLPTLSLNLKRARTYAERMFRHVSGHRLMKRVRSPGSQPAGRDHITEA